MYNANDIKYHLPTLVRLCVDGVFLLLRLIPHYK